MKILDVKIDSIPGNDLLRVTVHSERDFSGEAFCSGVTAQTLGEMASEVLPGCDPGAVSAIWDELGRVAGEFDAGEAAKARAALDIACWDLKARINKEPLWRTLGGRCPRAVAYASMRSPALPDEATRERFQALVSSGGFRQGLLRLGDDGEGDAQVLAMMSAVLSDQGFPFDLMLDLGGVAPSEAIRRITMLEREHDITWVKGVSLDEDAEGCAQVAEKIRAAVCAGGNCASELEFLPFLKAQSANVIEIDMQLLGVTGTMRAADAAFGYELPVTLKAAPGNLPVHLASALPYFMGLEVADDGATPGRLTSAACFEHGRALATQRPGTGVQLANGSAS